MPTCPATRRSFCLREGPVCGRSKRSVAVEGPPPRLHTDTLTAAVGVPLSLSLATGQRLRILLRADCARSDTAAGFWSHRFDVGEMASVQPFMWALLGIAIGLLVVSSVLWTAYYFAKSSEDRMIAGAAVGDESGAGYEMTVQDTVKKRKHRSGSRNTSRSHTSHRSRGSSAHSRSRSPSTSRRLSSGKDSLADHARASRANRLSVATTESFAVVVDDENDFDKYLSSPSKKSRSRSRSARRHGKTETPSSPKATSQVR